MNNLMETNKQKESSEIKLGFYEKYQVGSRIKSLVLAGLLAGATVISFSAYHKADKIYDKSLAQRIEFRQSIDEVRNNIEEIVLSKQPIERKKLAKLTWNILSLESYKSLGITGNIDNIFERFDVASSLYTSNEENEKYVKRMMLQSSDELKDIRSQSNNGVNNYLLNNALGLILTSLFSTLTLVNLCNAIFPKKRKEELENVL